MFRLSRTVRPVWSFLSSRSSRLLCESTAAEKAHSTVLPPPPIKPAAQKAVLTPEEQQMATPAAMSLCSAHCISQCLTTVVALGIPDVIGAETLSFEQIVSRLGCKVNEDLLLRQLRLVASHGVLVESAGENGEFMYSLAPAGKLFQTDKLVPSIGSLLLHLTEPSYWNAWSKLPIVTFTEGIDRSPYEEAMGFNLFEYYKRNKVSAALFNDAMKFFSIGQEPGVLNGYDWSACSGKTVCDIGGGLGSIMGAIKKSHPKIRALVFDLPEVIDAITDPPEGVEFVKGDFFDPSTIPTCDVVFMKHIFHDWYDASCSRILQAFNTALPAHVELVIVDAIMPGPGEPDNEGTLLRKTGDCFMGVIGGKERTLAQWENLLSSNGWAIKDTADCMGVSLITAVKI